MVYFKKEFYGKFISYKAFKYAQSLTAVPNQTFEPNLYVCKFSFLLFQKAAKIGFGQAPLP